MIPLYRIRILDAAARDLARLDKPMAQRIVQRINWLGANLDAARPEALAGDLTGLYKLRVGDYRVLYEILHQEHIIVVHIVAHRKSIYRQR